MYQCSVCGAKRTEYLPSPVCAANNGIVNGISPTKFEPDTAITREQIAAILYRYENPETEALGDLTSYPDNGTVSDYAIPAMRWAVGEELITGSDGKLLPQNNATRAQIATILMRYLEKNH